MNRLTALLSAATLTACATTPQTLPEPMAEPATAPEAPDYSAYSEWQRPSAEILEVMHAPELPRIWTAPGAAHLLMADPIAYPSLAELSAPMHKLAGLRVNPELNGIHGRRGAVNPRILDVETGSTVTLDLPEGAEVFGVDWSVDGQRLALSVGHGDHIGLWVGTSNGDVHKVEGVALNPLLGNAVTWMPDQEHLRILRIPDRGPVR